MPKQIRSIAKKHLKNSEEVKIESSGDSLKLIEQLYWRTSGAHKLDAVSRVLEIEDYNGVIIFVRTRAASTELSDKLNARGHSCSPLNGDMNQIDRERTVQRLKDGHLNISCSNRCCSERS